MHDEDFFWAGVKEGKLLIQACPSCGTLRQPPGPMCPNCRALGSVAKQSSGRGTIHAWLVSQHPSKPDIPPRIVILVDLEEGVRLVSNLVGTPASDVKIGQKVEVFFADVDGITLPQFRLAGSKAAA